MPGASLVTSSYVPEGYLYTGYAQGIGIHQDERQAVELFQKACEGGGARGCLELGVHHEEGRGVPKDERRAAALFKKACLADTNCTQL